MQYNDCITIKPALRSPLKSWKCVQVFLVGWLYLTKYIVLLNFNSQRKRSNFSVVIICIHELLTKLHKTYYRYHSIWLFLTTYLLLCIGALPCMLSVKEAGNVGFKHKTSDTIKCWPTVLSEMVSAFDIYGGCTYAFASPSPLSLCVCVCVCAWVRGCHTAAENVGKQTQARNEISMHEEINTLLLKAFVFNAMWCFRLDCMRMADSIDQGSEFSYRQHCLISWESDKLRVWHT